jgi:RNA polymerase sigma-70 factor, ECF subfamily
VLFSTDNHLAARTLRGDNAAFGKLYRRHVARVFHLLRCLTGNTAEAEDLTQETFVAAYGALASWRKEGAFGTWLCGIAYKHYANAARHRRPETENWDAQETLPAPQGDPLQHWTRRERELHVQQAIFDLPPLCREVFVLVKVEGFAYREAADILGVPVGTVQSRLWRATQLLQRALSEEFTTQTESANAPTQTPRSTANPKGDNSDALQHRA